MSREYLKLSDVRQRAEFLLHEGFSWRELFDLGFDRPSEHSSRAEDELAVRQAYGSLIFIARHVVGKPSGRSAYGLKHSVAELDWRVYTPLYGATRFPYMPEWNFVAVARMCGAERLKGTVLYDSTDGDQEVIRGTFPFGLADESRGFLAPGCQVVTRSCLESLYLIAQEDS